MMINSLPSGKYIHILVLIITYLHIYSHISAFVFLIPCKTCSLDLSNLKQLVNQPSREALGGAGCPSIRPDSHKSKPQGWQL